MALELRPTCEHCNKKLAAPTALRRVDLQLRMHFSAPRVVKRLGGTSARTAAGGFMPRPDPAGGQDRRDGNYLGKHPASTHARPPAGPISRQHDRFRLRGTKKTCRRRSGEERACSAPTIRRQPRARVRPFLPPIRSTCRNGRPGPRPLDQAGSMPLGWSRTPERRGHRRVRAEEMRSASSDHTVHAAGRGQGLSGRSASSRTPPGGSRAESSCVFQTAGTSDAEFERDCRHGGGPTWRTALKRPGPKLCQNRRLEEIGWDPKHKAFLQKLLVRVGPPGITELIDGQAARRRTDLGEGRC